MPNGKRMTNKVKKSGNNGPVKIREPLIPPIALVRAKLLKPLSGCCRPDKVTVSSSTDRINLQTGREAVHGSSTAYEDWGQAFISNSPEAMNNSGEPQEYLEPIALRAAKENKKLSVQPVTSSTSRESTAEITAGFVRPPRVHSQIVSSRKSRAVSDGGVFSRRAGELAYLIVDLQEDPTENSNTGDDIDVVGENQQQLKTINLLQTESTMSLSSIREKLKKKPVTKAKPSKVMFRQKSNIGGDACSEENIEDALGGNLASDVADDVVADMNTNLTVGSSGVASISSDTAGDVGSTESASEVVPASCTETTPTTTSTESDTSVASSQEDISSPLSLDITAQSLRGQSPITITFNPAFSPPKEDNPSLSSNDLSSPADPSWCLSEPHLATLHLATDSVLSPSNFPPEPTAINPSTSTQDSDMESQESQRDAGKLKAPPPAAPSSSSRSFFSRHKLKALISSSKNKNTEKKGRSKTISVMPPTDSTATKSIPDIESAKAAAVQRAKERRKPPSKPLPYALSSKRALDLATASQQQEEAASKGLSSEQSRQPSIPPKPNSSPVKSIPLHPRLVRRDSPDKHFLSPPQLSSLTDLSPSASTSRSSLPSINSSLLSNTVQKRHPPMRPPPPKYTKSKSLDKPDAHGVLHSTKSSRFAYGSHSNPPSLTRGARLLPGPGDVSTPIPNPYSKNSMTSSEPELVSKSTNPTHNSVPLLSSGGVPVYEEIQDWLPLGTQGNKTVGEDNLKMPARDGCSHQHFDSIDATDADDYVDMNVIKRVYCNTKQCDDGYDTYVDMKPILQSKGQNDSNKEDDSESLYVEMKPAVLWPAPSSPAPLYAAITSSNATTSSSSKTLYYAAKDLLG